jgi:hypothetical protein
VAVDWLIDGAVLGQRMVARRADVRALATQSIRGSEVTELKRIR